MSDPHERRAEPAGFATRAIHAGQSPDPSTGAIMPPIYATSTYVQQSPGVHKGLDYGRSHNPTRWALERCVADLEGGAQAFAFASGLAAIATVLELLDAGSHIVSGDDIYGGTFRLFERVRTAQRRPPLQLRRPDRPGAPARRRCTPETSMVWVETPTNPLLSLADLRAIAEICRARGILCAGRQHLRQPLGAAAARARLRHRRALGDQVPQRPLRRDRRRRRRRRRRPAGAAARAARLPAERGRRDRRPVRQLPRAARREDAGAAHGAPLRQRARAGALAGAAAAGGAGALPGARLASAARAGARGRCTASAA